MWKLMGASALSWGSGQTAWTWYESVLGREVPSRPWPSGAAGRGRAAEPALRRPERRRTDDSATVLAILRQLKGLGARLAIDDFGTGYSSLSYLHRFPVDMLKIDRSFVERLSHASDNAELAWTVVRLGQSLQLQTVAEGVEDSAQFLAPRRMGCDIGRGYYFGKPMTGEAMGRLVGDELTVARSVTPAS